MIKFLSDQLILFIIINLQWQIIKKLNLMWEIWNKQKLKINQLIIVITQNKMIINLLQAQDQSKAIKVWDLTIN